MSSDVYNFSHLINPVLVDNLGLIRMSSATNYADSRFFDTAQPSIPECELLSNGLHDSGPATIFTTPYNQLPRSHRTWPIQRSHSPARSRYSPYSLTCRARTISPRRAPLPITPPHNVLQTFEPSHVVETPGAIPVPRSPPAYTNSSTQRLEAVVEFPPAATRVPALNSGALHAKPTQSSLVNITRTVAWARSIVDFYAGQSKESWLFFQNSENTLKKDPKLPSNLQLLKCQYMDPACDIRCYTTGCHKTDGASRHEKCRGKGFVVENFHEYVRHLWLHRDREQKSRLPTRLCTVWNNEVIDAQKLLDDEAGVVYPDYV
ncbi:hypothetical protein RhiJN_11087 [Ceratobasidium sp. AG-Ba]|nr:hypothetical protein RhiJN_11087 [Ceratobasidium sp. AG-Ba]QRW11798.1 hypothetical protein RhiLY_10797 [Ceratobasidium sp. AG-Ba]